MIATIAIALTAVIHVIVMVSAFCSVPNKLSITRGSLIQGMGLSFLYGAGWAAFLVRVAL